MRNTEAKIKAIAPWFGGKRTMAPLIVAELGKHTQYFEPFCGSMAVLFASLGAYKHARIVVSYYDCPKVRELYDGWTFVEHGRQKHLHVQNGRGARPKVAPEVLILNGPSYVEV